MKEKEEKKRKREKDQTLKDLENPPLQTSET